ncbi:MAG TPA: hypothetical protein PK239_06185 [Chitinophagales bacterium]|nr:hypothetical protein [Chitinophagales bacterium]
MPFWLASFTIQAQNIWIGGFPGRKADWNIAANWSKHHVPDEWDDVFIPNTSTTTFVYPLITSDVGMVGSITMSTDAFITVTNNGKLGIINKSDSNGVIRQTLFFSNQIVVAMDCH